MSVVLFCIRKVGEICFDLFLVTLKGLCSTEGTQMYRTSGLLDSMGEGEVGMICENSIETRMLSSVKQITSPGWMPETMFRAGTLGRPRGMGWRGRREGGSGWGTHVNPWLIHVNVWQKPLQYCKVISLQLIKIIGGGGEWLPSSNSFLAAK